MFPLNIFFWTGRIAQWVKHEYQVQGFIKTCVQISRIYIKQVWEYGSIIPLFLQQEGDREGP